MVSRVNEAIWWGDLTKASTLRADSSAEQSLAHRTAYHEATIQEEAEDEGEERQKAAEDDTEELAGTDAGHIDQLMSNRDQRHAVTEKSLKGKGRASQTPASPREMHFYSSNSSYVRSSVQASMGRGMPVEPPRTTNGVKYTPFYKSTSKEAEGSGGGGDESARPPFDAVSCAACHGSVSYRPSVPSPRELAAYKSPSRHGGDHVDGRHPQSHAEVHAATGAGVFGSERGQYSFQAMLTSLQGRGKRRCAERRTPSHTARTCSDGCCRKRPDRLKRERKEDESKVSQARSMLYVCNKTKFSSRIESSRNHA